mmetsp:Transcript_65556/g.174625  ORF Transcript_65556/g.174625 Transcript_65556/m.174625 type:complete len:288 (+) Transcript_65556:66-929(+)
MSTSSSALPGMLCPETRASRLTLLGLGAGRCIGRLYGCHRRMQQVVDRGEAVHCRYGQEHNIPAANMLQDPRYQLWPDPRRHSAKSVAIAADDSDVLLRDVEVVGLEPGWCQTKAGVCQAEQNSHDPGVRVAQLMHRQHERSRREKADNGENLARGEQGAAARLNHCDQGRVQALADQVCHVRHHEVELGLGRWHSKHVGIVSRVPVCHVVRAKVESDVRHEDSPEPRVQHQAGGHAEPAWATGARGLLLLAPPRRLALGHVLAQEAELGLRDESALAGLLCGHDLP